MKNDIAEIKRAIVPILRKNGVVKAGIFGSYARGEATRKSDVDILIKFNAKARKSLLDLVGLELELEENVGKKVDLVEYSVIHPRLKDQILHEEVRVI